VLYKVTELLSSISKTMFKHWEMFSVLNSLHLFSATNWMTECDMFPSFSCNQIIMHCLMIFWYKWYATKILSVLMCSKKYILGFLQMQLCFRRWCQWIGQAIIIYAKEKERQGHDQHKSRGKILHLALKTVCLMEEIYFTFI
jgi:hypothetical protein